MEERSYHPCELRFDGAVIYVLWYTNGSDGFVRDGEDRLVVAPSLDALREAGPAFDIATDLTCYDFDSLRAWCESPAPSSIRCVEFLNAWNFFDDLAGSRPGFNSLSQGASSCYERLFWGCNLPAMTPPGEHFEPRWSAEDCEAIRDVMTAGLEMLREEIARKSPIVAG